MTLGLTLILISTIAFELRPDKTFARDFLRLIGIYELRPGLQQPIAYRLNGIRDLPFVDGYAWRTAGEPSVVFDAAGLANGVYLYVLHVGTGAKIIFETQGQDSIQSQRGGGIMICTLFRLTKLRDVKQCVIGLAVLLPLLFYGYPIQAQSQPVPPFRIGINFPFRNPEAASLATYLRLVHEGGASAMRQMTFADVHWVQVEPQNDAWNFVRADSAINNAYGIHSVPTLYHISAGGNDQTGLQVPWRACTNPGCGWDAARDSSDSKDYVQTVVHRYDSHVKYWEIANEMSGKMRRPTGLPLTDFIDFMQRNYRWVKEADPEARVLISGLLGTYGLPMELPRNWLRQFLAGGGVGSFDILSYHDYNSWWTLPVHYDSLKAVLTEFGLGSMPLWCTESSISSDPTTSITPDYASIDEQAADVWRRPAVLFAKGLQIYFWHSSWSSGGSSAWREFGIIDSHGTKKKAFHAYKLLTEKIKGFDTATLLSFGRVTDDNTSGGEGTWVVRFEPASQFSGPGLQFGVGESVCLFFAGWPPGRWAVVGVDIIGIVKADLQHKFDIGFSNRVHRLISTGPGAAVSCQGDNSEQSSQICKPHAMDLLSVELPVQIGFRL